MIILRRVFNNALLTPLKLSQVDIICELRLTGALLHYYIIVLLIILTLIFLRLCQQHYCYNVTGQSQESEGSCKPARIKEVHSKVL